MLRSSNASEAYLCRLPPHVCSCTGDPDPEGERVKVVSCALRDNPHIVALFWDVRCGLSSNPPPSEPPPDNPYPHPLSRYSWQYASLHQHTADGKVKRTEEENAQFKAALKVPSQDGSCPVRSESPPQAHHDELTRIHTTNSNSLHTGQVMADVYASAVGTTVLQIKEIPPRPARFDGAICLFELQTGMSKAAVRAAIREVFAPFGSIVNFELDCDPAVVRFSTHDAALKAKAKYSEGVPDLFSGLDMQYNERSYNGRRGEDERTNDNGRGWYVLNPRMTESRRVACPVGPCPAAYRTYTLSPVTQVLLRERREW